MINWLRRVTPDLFLAAVVALLMTVALDKLDTIESDRIVGGVRWAAQDGLTIDERIGRLTAKLSELGLVEDTILIFQSDHGQCIGQIGRIHVDVNIIFKPA